MTKHERELAMLVRRLIRALKKHDPASQVARQASDYLAENNMQGSILRKFENLR